MQSAYKVQEGQTLFDVAIHNYGSVEAAFELAALNGVALTDAIRAGSDINLPKQVSTQHVNRYVVAAIVNRNLIPRTAPDIAHELGGIGHMQIWVSLKVG